MTRAVVLCMLGAIGLALCVASQGCSWTLPDWAAKGQAALKKEVSPRVEVPLKAECVERAKTCKAKGISKEQCTPVNTCLDWTARYVAATKAVHKGLGMLNTLWHDLAKEKVVK